MEINDADLLFDFEENYATFDNVLNVIIPEKIYLTEEIRISLDKNKYGKITIGNFSYVVHRIKWNDSTQYYDIEWVCQKSRRARHDRDRCKAKARSIKFFPQIIDPGNMNSEVNKLLLNNEKNFIKDINGNIIEGVKVGKDIHACSFLDIHEKTRINVRELVIKETISATINGATVLEAYRESLNKNLHGNNIPGFTWHLLCLL